MGLFNYRDLLLELNINGKTIDDNGDPVEDNKKPTKTDNDNEEYTEPEDEEPTDYTDNGNNNEDNTGDNEEYTEPEDEEPTDYTDNGNNNNEDNTGDNEEYTEPEDEEPTDYNLPDDEEDNTNTEDQNNNDEQQETDGNDKGADNQTPDDYTEPEDVEPTDYTKETGDDDNGDDDNNDTDNTDNGSDSSSEVDNGNTSELQSAENKLFADLSPEQMAIKNRELKQKFIDIYKTTSYILYKFTSVPKSSFNNKSIVFVVNKLNKLRDIVFDYISETFFTKTYIENSIMLQEFIVTLNTINNIISELQIEFKDENKKSKK